MGAEAGSSLAKHPTGSRHVTAKHGAPSRDWSVIFVHVTAAGAGGGATSVHATVVGPGFDSRRVSASTATIRHWIARLGRSPSSVTAPSLRPFSGTKTRLKEPNVNRPSDRSESAESSTELDRSDHAAADDDDDDEPAAE